MGRPRDYCGYFVTNNHGIKPYKNDYLNLSLNESAKQTFHILIEIQREKSKHGSLYHSQRQFKY